MICVSKPSKTATVVHSATIRTWKRLSRAPRTIALISTSPRSLMFVRFPKSPSASAGLIDQEIAGFAFDRRRAGIERDADRIAARGDDIGLLHEEAAQHYHALVGRRQMFFGMQRH